MKIRLRVISDLADPNISQVKLVLVDLSPQGAVKQLDRPTQAPGHQLGAVLLPTQRSDRVQVLYLLRPPFIPHSLTRAPVQHPQPKENSSSYQVINLTAAKQH